MSQRKEERELNVEALYAAVLKERPRSEPHGHAELMLILHDVEQLKEQLSTADSAWIAQNIADIARIKHTMIVTTPWYSWARDTAEQVATTCELLRVAALNRAEAVSIPRGAK